MALPPCTPALASLLLVVSLAGPVFSDDDCEAYADSSGWPHGEKSCSFLSFCCGTCDNRYCCMTSSQRLSESAQRMCSITDGPMVAIVVGISVFVIFTVSIIVCFTCSCCCLYKMCRRPRPVVTTTTATVIHAPYPQQQGIPAAYPAAQYQGYQPIQPSPAYAGPMPVGMPTAPYPTPYPPPYASQLSGPPGYQETMATGAGVPYPAAQPPYNPAYMDSAKPAY
uniref:Protein shisa-5 n=1 Tax=Geotrypetes seraphini TaxID=260995 RepID=A0A6P8Q5I4_GEOSA|nr:protein shisa-5 isoform X2 [Geotrypetes seraphini]